MCMQMQLRDFEHILSYATHTCIYYATFRFGRFGEVPFWLKDPKWPVLSRFEEPRSFGYQVCFTGLSDLCLRVCLALRIWLTKRRSSVRRKRSARCGLSLWWLRPIPPSSYEASSSSDTVGENQLLAIMLACSSHRPATANERDAMRAFHELRSFASGCKVELNALTALQLAAFMRAHKAPTRAYNALFWMNKNLKLGYDTSLLIKPAKKSALTKFGGGAKQAPVIRPVAITVLETCLEAEVRHHRLHVVRFTHIQRSVLRPQRHDAFEDSASSKEFVGGCRTSLCALLSFVQPSPPAAAAADVVEVDEPAVDPSDPPQTDDPDEFFDRLARARWSSAGHSGHAEPASLVHRGQHGSGNLWLGGLPCSSEEAFLKRQRISFVVSAMREKASDLGASAARFLQRSVPVSYHGRDR